ncbi:DUF4229 domain-containing protein [Microbacterium indicum]|uniref:DUF4229 domain-containing protein n=1 Tax=Microbacterium indicum TaxID=358100 RepID=UPI0003F9EC1A|nr:DUF4229 domain-containing protein [Microbacterium indicum]
MKIRSVILYSVLRILFFVVPLAILLVFPVFQSLWWLAVIFAALIGVSLSILVLQRPLGQVSEGIYDRRRTKKTKKPHAKTARELDEDVENDANERIQGEKID